MTDVKIKKVKPYPIPCILSKGTEAHNGGILRLETIGFYVEEANIHWSPSDRIIIEFVLPVRNVRIKAYAMLVKVTNSLMPDPAKKLHKRLEFQFIDLPVPAIKQIKLFCEAINQ
jgi:hypothetical protein